MAGAVLCDFEVVFAWQGHDFRIVRLDFRQVKYLATTSES